MALVGWRQGFWQGLGQDATTQAQRKRSGMGWSNRFAAGCVLLVGQFSHAITDDAFKTSFEAARAGDWSHVSDAASDHVLAPYIEYHRLKQALPDVAVSDIDTYRNAYSDSPLSRWIVRQATQAYGAARQWQDVLDLNPRAPGDTAGQCIYYRAKLIEDQQEAFKGGLRLWLKGRSQPDQCDDLFKAMRARGEITDAHVWRRALLALKAGNTKLSGYLLKQLPDDADSEWPARVDYLNEARRTPARLLTKAPGQDIALRSEVTSAVMTYLVAKDTAAAAALMADDEVTSALENKEQRRIEKLLAKRSYRFDAEDRPTIIGNILAERGSADLIGPVLREAIARSDWQGVIYWLDQIQGTDRESAYHIYWRARALEQTGNEDAAQTLYRQAAAQRSFYGFLAAEKLALPYAMNNQRPALANGELEEASEVRPMARVQALWNIGEEGLAIEEWNYLLQRQPKMSAAYAEIALERGWPGLAVQASIQGRLWNSLDYRFPSAYQDEFSRWASHYEVDSSLLMAIARRESAFNPHARSPVGARGLMQMMPATARQVAKEKDYPLADTDALMQHDVNIPLASYYVRSLNDKYQGNLIAVLAGYNAGPHKVDRWLETAPATYDQFIESIPYRETREYVKAVLAYRVIFNQLQGQDVSAVLAPDERAFGQQLSRNSLVQE